MQACVCVHKHAPVLHPFTLSEGLGLSCTPCARSQERTDPRVLQPLGLHLTPDQPIGCCFAATLCLHKQGKVAGKAQYDLPHKISRTA